MRGRLQVAAALLAATVPALVAAQSSRPDPATGSLPPIGLGLPQIGLSLPPLGLPPAIDRHPGPEGRPLDPGQSRHRRRGDRKDGHGGRSLVFVVPPYYYWDYAATERMETVRPAFDYPASGFQEPDSQTGTLRLDVPFAGTVELYVDGYYVGTLDDAGGELELEAGPHRIEIRAAGHETIVLDVKVAPGRTITYRASLVPLAAKPAAEPPVRPAKAAATEPIFFIPGCYLGNVPPKDAALPATCDERRVMTLER